MQVKNIDARFTLNGDCEVILTVPKGERDNIKSLMDEFKSKMDKVWEAVISVKRKKRSLDANAKAWLLLGQIAEELSKETPISAEEIYKRMIPDISKGEIIPIRNEAVETWIYNWEHKPSTKIGWISKSLGKSKIEGYTNTINWFGSSCFDTIEMHKLLTLIVQECKQLDIETLSPAELERLVQMHGQ
jgi:hypothetical protein